MNMADSLMDRIFPARKLLRKAAGEEKPPEQPAQDTRYIKQQIEEHMKQKAREGFTGMATKTTVSKPKPKTGLGKVFSDPPRY